MPYTVMMLARKSRVHMLAGHEEVGWKSWNDATQTAVQSLKSDPESSVKINKMPLRNTMPLTTEEQISTLLDSADNGAKMIVP